VFAEIEQVVHFDQNILLSMAQPSLSCVPNAIQDSQLQFEKTCDLGVHVAGLAVGKMRRMPRTKSWGMRLSQSLLVEYVLETPDVHEVYGQQKL
jgi:hypothetical protein